MRKIKMTLAMVLGICLLTACGQHHVTDVSIFDDLFEEVEPPVVSEEVIEAMEYYEKLMSAYCEFLKVFNAADMTTQAKHMAEYTKYADVVGEYQEKMEKVLDMEDEISEVDYAYIQSTYIEWTEKVFDAAADGFNYPN